MYKYPPFNQSEYKCFTENLSVVDFYLKWHETEEKIREKQAEREALARAVNESLTKAKEAILDDVKSMLDRPKEGRKERLGRALQIVQGTLSYPNDIANRARRQAASAQVFREYAQFDIDEFFAHCDQLISSEDSKKMAGIKKLSSEIDNLIAQNKKLWASYPKHFKFIPKVWRNTRIREGENIDSKLEESIMARRIIQNFVKDWRSRGLLFDRPVTVTGVSIGSLPKAKRRAWQSAYKKLNIEKPEKRPYYDAIVSQEKEPVNAE